MVHATCGIILQSRDLCLVLCSGLLFQEITATQRSTFVADLCLMTMSKNLERHPEKPAENRQHVTNELTLTMNKKDRCD